jgi:hypothetical protein
MIDQGYSRLDKLDGLRDEDLFPCPVLARDVPLWQAETAVIVRRQIRALERYERAARRADRRAAILFALVLFVAAVVVLAVFS